MGGTFRFMTHFVGALAFLCAGAYKGAQVYAFKHRPCLYWNYTCFTWSSHAAPKHLSLLETTEHVSCYYHITLVCSLLSQCSFPSHDSQLTAGPFLGAVVPMPRTPHCRRTYLLDIACSVHAPKRALSLSRAILLCYFYKANEGLCKTDVMKGLQCSTALQDTVYLHYIYGDIYVDWQYTQKSKLHIFLLTWCAIYPSGFFFFGCELPDFWSCLLSFKYNSNRWHFAHGAQSTRKIRL